MGKSLGDQSGRFKVRAKRVNHGDVEAELVGELERMHDVGVAEAGTSSIPTLLHSLYGLTVVVNNPQPITMHLSTDSVEVRRARGRELHPPCLPAPRR